MEESPTYSLMVQREQPENGFPSMLYIQWEVSRQQDKLYHPIPAGAFLVPPLSPEDRPHSQESFYTSLKSIWTTVFSNKNLAAVLFSFSCSQSVDLDITN